MELRELDLNKLQRIKGGVTGADDAVITGGSSPVLSSAPSSGVPRREADRLVVTARTSEPPSFASRPSPRPHLGRGRGLSFFHRPGAVWWRFRNRPRQADRVLKRRGGQ
jgi:hypothetical protein